jgi:hypothetical protein
MYVFYHRAWERPRRRDELIENAEIRYALLYCKMRREGQMREGEPCRNTNISRDRERECVCVEKEHALPLSAWRCTATIK